MKMHSLILFLLLTINLRSEEFTNWEDITNGLNHKPFVEIRAYENNLLLCTEGAVYLYRQDKGSWQEIFSSSGKEKVVDGALDERNLFVATEHNVYFSNRTSISMRRIFNTPDQSPIRSIAISPNAHLFVGTTEALCIIDTKNSSQNTCLRDIKRITILLSHPFHPDILFVGTETGLYRVNKGGKDIKLIYSAISIRESKINGVAVSKTNDDVIYIATDAGLIRMRIKDREFRDMKLNDSIISVNAFGGEEERIVALGENTIYYAYANEWEKWKRVTGAIPAGKPINMLITGRGEILLLTQRGIFKEIKAVGDSAEVLEKLEGLFRDEPELPELERLVLESFLIEPGSIRRWRRNARLRALLPKVDVGVNRGIDMDYDLRINDTIFTSATSGRYYIGPDEHTWNESRGMDYSYTVKLSWDLSEILFSNDELSVRNEAEDIMEFRSRILNELRRVFYERRRAIAELYLLPPSDAYRRFELKNRIDELTAYIDSMCNGYFSKAIKSRKEASQ